MKVLRSSGKHWKISYLEIYKIHFHDNNNDVRKSEFWQSLNTNVVYSYFSRQNLTYENFTESGVNAVKSF